MKKKSKLICIILVIFLLILVSYNYYQYKKINNYKNYLTGIARHHIEHFACLSDNIDDEHIYAEKYASIIIAKEVFNISRDNNMLSSEDCSSSLSILLLQIETILGNDKEKFKEVLKKPDFTELLFKISINLEDKDSISKLQKLLNE